MAMSKGLVETKQIRPSAPRWLSIGAALVVAVTTLLAPAWPALAHAPYIHCYWVWGRNGPQIYCDREQLPLPPPPATNSVHVGDVWAPESSGTATFTVTRDAPTGISSVSFETHDGSAIAGSDYAAARGTLVFSSGETAKQVSVALASDAVAEPDENFELWLTTPANATITRGRGTAIITDGPPSLSVGDASVVEGAQKSSSALVFTIALSHPSTETVTVQVATADGTATGSDYVQGPPATLSIPPGVAGATIAVTVKGDNKPEPDETMFIDLSQPVNATVADGRGIGTITNDD
jgi:hypothetical protein